MLIRRITLAALVAALVGGLLAVPASSKTGPVASASKCKKAKKGKKHRKKKKRRCGTSPSEATLPGEATHQTPNPPPPALGMSAIAVSSNPVLAGSSTSGQVTVSAAAPAVGQSVALQSSNPARVTVPSSVLVPAGQTTANFPISTTAGANTAVTLTGSIGTSNATTQLNVVSAPSVESVALERQCFTPGTFSANQVTLDVAPTADTLVNLASDTPLSLAVPGTALVPAGSKNALFAATAMAVPASPVTVTASGLGSSQASDQASVSATTNPAASGLSLSPDTVTVGSGSIGTVTLNCEAGPGGTVVNLSSGGAPEVSFPLGSMVTVPQDQLSVTFPIATSGSTIGDEVITADGGGSQAQATLHVNSLGT